MTLGKYQMAGKTCPKRWTFWTLDIQVMLASIGTTVLVKDVRLSAGTWRGGWDVYAEVRMLVSLHIMPTWDASSDRDQVKGRDLVTRWFLLSSKLRDIWI